MADPVVAAPTATGVVVPEATTTPAVAAPGKTELGTAPTDPVVAAVVDPAPKPVEGEAPKLGPDGKPLPAEKATDAPAAFALDKIKLPEGMKSDDPLLVEYSGIMSDDKLAPLERGQKLLDLYHGAVKKAGESNVEAWNTVKETWVKEIKADPEIGGVKFDQSKTTIARAIDSMGQEKAAAFREALDVTGAGDNPAVFRGMLELASKLTEGGHVAGAPAQQGAKPSIKEAFYPNSPDMK